ncbi:MAG: carbohydrate binding domain-containing protein [Bacteroidales bacterium]
MKKITLFGAALLISASVFAELKLENKWVNKQVTGNAGSAIRDMDYHGDMLYLQDKGAKLIRVIDVADGSEKPTIVTGGTGYSVTVSPAGTVCYSIGAYGMTGRIEMYKWDGAAAVEMINSGSGNGTCAPLENSRIDYIDVIGDIEGKGGYLAGATVNNSDKIAVWKMENGAAVNASAPLVIADARGGFALGADVNWVNDNQLWVSGQDKKPCFFEIDHSAKTFEKKELGINKLAASGITQFTLNKVNYVAVPANDKGSIEIYDITDIANPVLIGEKTADIGATANGLGHVCIESSVTGNVATILVWAPNNGAAAYTFEDTSAGGGTDPVNLVVNGNFTDGTNGWTMGVKPADKDAYVFTATEGLSIAQTKAASDRLDMSQDIQITPGKTYKISFDYKSTHAKFRIWSFGVSEHDVWVYTNGVGSAAKPEEDPLRTNNKYFPIAEDWTPMEYTYVAPDSISNFRLMFRVYKQADSEHNIRNITMVQTTGTGMEQNVAQEAKVYAADGKVFVEAAAGEKIAVYSMMGHQLAVLNADNGINEIGNLPVNEILIVRVGTKATKVIIR